MKNLDRIGFYEDQMQMITPYRNKSSSKFYVGIHFSIQIYTKIVYKDCAVLHRIFRFKLFVRTYQIIS